MRSKLNEVTLARNGSIDLDINDEWLMFNIFTWYKYRTYFYKYEPVQEKLKVVRDLFRELNIALSNIYPKVLAEDENGELLKLYTEEFYREANLEIEQSNDEQGQYSLVKTKLGEDIFVKLRRDDNTGVTNKASMYCLKISKKDLNTGITDNISYTFPLKETFKS